MDAPLAGQTAQTDQALSLALSESNWYQARLLATLIGSGAGDPPADGRVGRGGLGRLRHGLFQALRSIAARMVESDRMGRVAPRVGFRGGFMLMACLALHDKTADDGRFLPLLPLIEEGARDQRPSWPGHQWTVRSIGGRDLALHVASMDVAPRLSTSDQSPCARWGRMRARALEREGARAARAAAR